MKKFLCILVVLLASVGLATNASAISITGGDAADQASADDILDIVFVFDTSGSMADEINALVPQMQSIVNNINCPDCDVWVRARLMGITQNTYGLGENVRSYVTGTGNVPVSDHLEDNAPAVEDIANHFAWNDDSTASQDYYKAIVTLGDEGLENGYEPSGINQADWDAGYAANQAAIANGVMVFSVVGTPWGSYAADQANRDAAFAAMAVGGSGGGYTFGNTGGSFVSTTTGNQGSIETDIENIICTAAGGGHTVPEPATFLLLGTGLIGIAAVSRKKR